MTIRVGLCLPVYVDLDVTVDDAAEDETDGGAAVKIHRGNIANIQSALTERSVMEQCNEETIAHIVDVARKAFEDKEGIET
jgi:hypothetical protein